MISAADVAPERNLLLRSLRTPSVLRLSQIGLAASSGRYIIKGARDSIWLSPRAQH